MGDAEKLVGHWRLAEWSGRTASGECVRHGGDQPSGDLIYLESGHMAVQIQFDVERSEQPPSDTYLAYCGRWEIREPGTIVHCVELALHPDNVGIEKVRPYALEGDQLVLETQPLDTGEGLASSVIRWRRI